MPGRRRCRLLGTVVRTAAITKTAPAKHGTESGIAQLAEIAELQERGILTDEEFSAQKAQVIGD